MKIIIGLGNPGTKYARTRHNIGFRIIDALAEKEGIGLKQKKLPARAYIGQGRIDSKEIMLVKPMTYMNSSGEAARDIVERSQEPLENVLVVCDDIQLPHGKIRVRRLGSSGGQKGLESVINLLGNNNFPRLRIGTGSAEPVGDAAEFVLDNFTAAEEKLNRKVITNAIEAVRCWIADGIEKCMNKFN
ncbi:MAG: aminoacyl-tRNA hydrolase [Planctomycetes bacterium]|nr:aminoacyl-tRNA hydrolase [Planctomycetota bacterium]